MSGTRAGLARGSRARITRCLTPRAAPRAGLAYGFRARVTRRLVPSSGHLARRVHGAGRAIQAGLPRRCVTGREDARARPGATRRGSPRLRSRCLRSHHRTRGPVAAPALRISGAMCARVACQKRAVFREAAAADGSGRPDGPLGALLHDTRQRHQRVLAKSSRRAQNRSKFLGKRLTEPPFEPSALDATSRPLVAWHEV